MKERKNGGGQRRPRDYRNKGDGSAAFGGVLTHEVGDGRVDEECTRMCRRDKYNANRGVNRNDGDRDTAGVKEVTN